METTLSVEQQMELNVNRYDVDTVAKMFTRKELAQTIATTCWDEQLVNSTKNSKQRKI